jgi:phosphoribosylglycinamide formyltransferase 1
LAGWRLKKRANNVTKKKVGVLISGNGSNLQALLDACLKTDYPADIVVVISNKSDAYGLTRAQRAGIAYYVVNHQDYPTREVFDDAVHELLVRHQVELVCLAGFMRLLSAVFVERWKGKLLNIHPSLLPAFKGAYAVRDALAASAKVTGCTVHQVVVEVDAGPIVMQAEVPILPDDNEDSLHQRIHAQEHIIYPLALKKILTSQ